MLNNFLSVQLDSGGPKTPRTPLPIHANVCKHTCTSVTPNFTDLVRHLTRSTRCRSVRRPGWLGQTGWARLAGAGWLGDVVSRMTSNRLLQLNGVKTEPL
jgi:hypothetical protein